MKIIKPNPDEHLLPIAQLAANAFTGGQYVEQFCQNYIGNSHYDWNVSRLVMDGDQVIHHWGVWGYQMRLESIQLKVAGIGAVVTHEAHRKQGWMHEAAQDSFDAMLEAGYDLSILRGRHYVKMGYTRAWNYVNYRFTPSKNPISLSARSASLKWMNSTTGHTPLSQGQLSARHIGIATPKMSVCTHGLMMMEGWRDTSVPSLPRITQNCFNALRRQAIHNRDWLCWLTCSKKAITKN